MERSVNNRNPPQVWPVAAAGLAALPELRKEAGDRGYVVLWNPFVFYTIAISVYYNVRVVGTPAIRMGECLQG